MQAGIIDHMLNEITNDVPKCKMIVSFDQIIPNPKNGQMTKSFPNTVIRIILFNIFHFLSFLNFQKNHNIYIERT